MYSLIGQTVKTPDNTIGTIVDHTQDFATVVGDNSDKVYLLSDLTVVMATDTGWEPVRRPGL